MQRRQKRNQMAGALKTRITTRQRTETRPLARERNQDLAKRRAVAVVAVREAAEAIQSNSRMTAVEALRKRVTQFVDQNRHKHDCDPDDGLHRVGPPAAAQAEQEQ